MRLSDLFKTLRGCSIIERTIGADGKDAMPASSYKLVQVGGPGERVGYVECLVRKNGRLVVRDLQALALLELTQKGTSEYTFSDTWLSLARAINGRGPKEGGETFTTILTKSTN